MVAELARRPGSGILGIISSIRPENAPGFDAWVEEGRDLGVVGYRRILHEVPTTCRGRATFRANVRKLGARGLPFDMCFLARQLPIALELARACDDTAFVLDHCGDPDIAAGAVDAWRAGRPRPRRDAERHRQALRRLRQRRPRHRDAGDGPPLRRARDRGLRARPLPLGQRLAGGEHPGADLPSWIAAFRAILAGFSPAEQAAMAHGTAERVYGVRLPAAGEA